MFLVCSTSNFGANNLCGPLAHLVERLVCTEEVAGSSPVGSTNEKTALVAVFSLVDYSPRRTQQGRVDVELLGVVLQTMCKFAARKAGTVNMGASD
jgi:hypothetical protein